MRHGESTHRELSLSAAKKAMLLMVATLVTVLAAAAAAPAQTMPRGTLDANCPDGSERLAGHFRFDGDHVARQTFVAGRSGRLAAVQALVLRQAGGGGGGITVELNPVTDAGNPTNEVLASATVPGSEVPTGAETTITANFDPASAPKLVSSKKYAITLRTTDTASNTWTVRDSSPCPDGNFFEGENSWVRFDAVHAVFLGPGNDDFAASRVISGNDVSVSGTTAAATREAGEPDHYTTGSDAFSWLGDHSVWYRWRAPVSGTTTVDTCASSIDGILAVYKGANLAGLQRVAENNNGCANNNWGSRVTFQAVAGTTYHLAVGDAGGLREAGFTLRLSAPPYAAPANDDFANAQRISGSSASVFGTNFGATRESGDPASIVVDPTAGHSVWYRWRAPDSGSASVSVCSDDLRYAGVAAYTGASLDSLSLVADSYDCASSPNAKASFAATAETTYRFFVDACDCEAPQGTFTFSLNFRDEGRPKLVAHAPARKKGVSPTAKVTASFSEAMNGEDFADASGHLYLKKKGSSETVPARYSLNATGERVILNPTRALDRGATYVATVTAGARDLAGNGLAAGKTWEFTVER